jgi:diguanylate cyclase (GGDEF)-like protein
MPQLPDFSKNFNVTQGWDEVCYIADLFLRERIESWVSASKSPVQVDVALWNRAQQVTSLVFSLGESDGFQKLLTVSERGAPSIDVTVTGDATEGECETLLRSIETTLKWINSLQAKLIQSNLFNLAPVIMYQAEELGGRWVLTQANSATADFLGVSLADLLGGHAKVLLTDLVHPDDIDNLLHSYDSIRSTSKELTVHYRLRRSDGQYQAVTERVSYTTSNTYKRCSSVVWHRDLDQQDSENQFGLFKNIETFTQNISFETGLDFLLSFCKKLESIDVMNSLVLVAQTRSHWWETCAVIRRKVQQADFQIQMESCIDLSQPSWNDSAINQQDPLSQELLFGKSNYQSILPLTFDDEPIQAAILIGSEFPIRNIEHISQMVRLFGIRVIREIGQIRIADAQRDQNELLVKQKHQLTQMVTLLGQLDTVADEQEFLKTTEAHLRKAFDVKNVNWVFWSSGQWLQINSLDQESDQRWHQDALPVNSPQWLAFLENCRRTGEITYYRGGLRIFWPIGPSEAGFLVCALTFQSTLPDDELILFSQNALSLAQQGLVQRENLRYQAMRDSLTGLGNRVQLHAWMKAGLPSLPKASLLLFDLNRFKEINDSFGHQFGDKLLQEIGPRISINLTNQEHYLSRLGGDEFALFLPNVEREKAVNLASHLHSELAKSYAIDGLRFQVEASVGVSHYPEHGADGHELLRCADVAMYSAKNSNRNVVAFNSELDTTTPLRIAVLSGLDEALSENHLWVAYQPLMSTKTGQTAGFEALVRWSHPEFGSLSPAEFIPIAEMGEGIRKITDFVLRQTMEFLLEWRKIMPSVHVAVNVSPRVLLDHQFPINVEAMLKEYDLPGESIIMELTESTLLVDPIRAVEIIDSLALLGIKVEIDDFGTGYSSLAYLKSLPISALKIDRSFVTDILEDNHNEVIVSSTVQMAHSMGLQIVAEGVEDEATLLKLMRLGCDMIQGYYFAKPLPGIDVASWLKRNI